MQSFVVRRWHGRVRTADAERYLAIMRDVSIPDYRKTPGNLGAFCAHRAEGEVTHIETVSFWRSREDIVAFAGEDITLAYYYDIDDQFLLEKERHVTHFDAFGELPSGRS
jgi:hypothetical protein